MPEPTDPFSHFDPEVPMPLSAGVIRRRGDRLRRRNVRLAIAGGVAAIALVAVPLALLAGGDETASVQPAAPTDAGTPGPDLASFPLALGWPDPSDVDEGSPGLEGPTQGGKQSDFEVCGELLGLPETDGDLHAAYNNAVDIRSRELLTFTDADGAADLMAQVRDFYAGCPTEADSQPGSTRRHEIRDTAQGGESFAVVDSTTVGQAQVPGVAVYQFIRLGRAVLIDTTYDETVRSDAPDVIDAMSRASAGVVGAMCVFTEAGC